MDKVIEELSDFNKCFDVFFKDLARYFIGKYDPNSKESIVSPSLRESVINLFVSYSILPEMIKNRLNSVNFDIFILYATDNDLYNFRDYVLNNTLHYKMAEIASRVDAETEFMKKYLGYKTLDTLNRVPTGDLIGNYKDVFSKYLITDEKQRDLQEKNSVYNEDAFFKNINQDTDLKNSDKKIKIIKPLIEWLFKIGVEIFIDKTFGR